MLAIGGIKIPQVVLTTCRRPSPRIRTYLNDLSRLLPNSRRLTRGKLSLKGLTEKMVQWDSCSLLVLERWRLGACKISFFTIDSQGLGRIPPQIYVKRFVTHLERKGRGTRIPVVSKIGLHSNDGPARRLAAFLSSHFNMEIVEPANFGRVNTPILTVTSTAEGRVRLSVGIEGSNENIPSLYIGRMIWDE